MLKLALISATILISITAAQAQYGPHQMPFIPGLAGNPGVYGKSFADDYNRGGENYARQRAAEPSPYQPYPSVTPAISDPYGMFNHRSHSLYGNDD